MLVLFLTCVDDEKLHINKVVSAWYYQRQRLKQFSRILDILEVAATLPAHSCLADLSIATHYCWTPLVLHWSTPRCSERFTATSTERSCQIGFRYRSTSMSSRLVLFRRLHWLPVCQRVHPIRSLLVIPAVDWSRYSKYLSLVCRLEAGFA